MEGDLRRNFDFEVAAEGGGDDGKVLAGLSTVLVATIQEVKDRISHIEFLFCSQLFPRIQSRSRMLQRRLSAGEARREAGEEWAEKEASLLRQIEELRLGKQRAEEEARRLAASVERERAEVAGRHEAEKALLLKKLESAERTKETVVAELEERLRIRAEEEARRLAASVEREKAEVADRHEAEKVLLLEKLESAERAKETMVIELTEQLRVRVEEDARRLAASVERERAEVAGRHEAEKALLLEKLEKAERAKESVVAELKEQLGVRADELDECKGLVGKLLERIDLGEMELEGEKRKQKQSAYSYAMLEKRYKNLKSQYCFLLRKAGLTPEPMDVTDSETCSPVSLPNKRKSPQDPESRDEGDTLLAAKTDEAEDEGGIGEQAPSSNATPTGDLAAVSSKPEPLGGSKSTLTSWVDTRARQETRGVDPHDDFLDTPLESIRENLRKMPDDEPHGIPDLAPNDSNDSDGEIKQVNIVPVVQKPQISVLKPEKKGYKYVEPVRKKADRENLKGVECKQCKKFYDAVLPDDRGKDGKKHSGGRGEVRCEHHEGVSRHRYNYIPPMTPEGFWNIGFDTEMCRLGDA